MADRIAKVVGIAAGALVLVGAIFALSASSDEGLNPAAEVVADLPTVSDFSIRAQDDRCEFDADRGGLVYEGLTIESRSTGVLDVSFYVQRDSLDDILPATSPPSSRSTTTRAVTPSTSSCQ